MAREAHPDRGQDRIHDVPIRSEGLEARAWAIQRVLVEEGYEVGGATTRSHPPAAKRMLPAYDLAEVVAAQAASLAGGGDSSCPPGVSDRVRSGGEYTLVLRARLGAYNAFPFMTPFAGASPRGGTCQDMDLPPGRLEGLR